MKVRLTSDNILKNGNTFDVWNRTTECPTGFFANGGVFIKPNWEIIQPGIIYSAKDFKFITTLTNIYDYIDVYKGVVASGTGTYKNVISGAAFDLKGLYFRYENLADENEINTNGLNQEIVTGADTRIKELNTYFVMETEMLRNPSYSDERISETLIVREKNSKKIVTAEQYTPVSTQLLFINCLEKTKAIQAFFNTCLAHGVGFSIEILETGVDAVNWATENWGASNWGSTEGGEQYSKKWHMDLNNTSFIESSATGSLTVPVILQKSELDYVS